MNVANLYKLYFFGCSFTSLETSNTGYKFINFRNIIKEKLQIETEDFSKSGKSNQEIINDVYEIGKNSQQISDKTPIFIIQTTFLDRLGMPFDLKEEFTSMCKRQNPDDFVDEVKINFYNDWLKYFYSRNNSKKEFTKQIALLSAWLRENNIKFILIGIDESIDRINELNSFFNKNNFLHFENRYYSYYSYATFKKLRISDMPEFNEKNIIDFHFNQEGHNILAESIIKKLKYYFE